MATDLAKKGRFDSGQYCPSPRKMHTMTAAIAGAAASIAIALSLLAPRWALTLVIAVELVLTLMTWHAPRCPTCGRRRYPKLWGVRSGGRSPF